MQINVYILVFIWQHFRNALAVVLMQISDGTLSASAKEKSYLCLVLSDMDQASQEKGKNHSDIRLRNQFRFDPIACQYLPPTAGKSMQSGSGHHSSYPNRLHHGASHSSGF
jgi:hypothetical protein